MALNSYFPNRPILIDSSGMTHNREYLSINIKGKTKEDILFESESNSEMEYACSFNLKDVNYIIGGLTHQKQV